MCLRSCIRRPSGSPALCLAGFQMRWLKLLCRRGSPTPENPGSIRVSTIPRAIHSRIGAQLVTGWICECEIVNQSGSSNDSGELVVASGDDSQVFGG